jgi:hypothetical protein
MQSDDEGDDGNRVRGRLDGTTSLNPKVNNALVRNVTPPAAVRFLTSETIQRGYIQTLGARERNQNGANRG